MNPSDLDASVVHRPAARVIVLCEDRVLLFRADLGERQVWITPGGGLNEGESPDDGARRELWEETGLTPELLGPCVWYRTHVFPWNGSLLSQDEHFYLLTLDSAPEMCFDNWEEIERDQLLEHRWWTVDEIAASSDLFALKDLALLLQPLLRGEYPSEPSFSGSDEAPGWFRQGLRAPPPP
jgi:8-oxo-dGTP pyrophosphatase MutT (NUDIX family)